MMPVQEAIIAAWARRAQLHADPGLDTYRLFHGWSEGGPGLEIDRYGDVVIIDCTPQRLADMPAVVAGLDACQRFDCIVARPRRGQPTAVRGELPAAGVVVHEHGLRFRIYPGHPGYPGLFLDARPARAWVRAHSRDRRVLNLFAFSGSLGVAAAVGGARGVVHVDSGRRALAWCQDNHQLNGVPVDQRSLARINVYQHLRRQQTGRLRFDGIIVDPPPLTELAQRTDRTPGGRGMAALLPLVTRMLAPGGWLLCFFHHEDERDHEELERQVLSAPGTQLAVLWRGHSGPDFPESSTRYKLRLTAFVRPADSGSGP